VRRGGLRFECGSVRSGVRDRGGRQSCGVGGGGGSGLCRGSLGFGRRKMIGTWFRLVALGCVCQVRESVGCNELGEGIGKV
jgi:hypothetical protein